MISVSAALLKPSPPATSCGNSLPALKWCPTDHESCSSIHRRHPAEHRRPSDFALLQDGLAHGGRKPIEQPQPQTDFQRLGIGRGHRVIRQPLPNAGPGFVIAAERRLVGDLGEREATLAFLGAMAIGAVLLQSQPRRCEIQRCGVRWWLRSHLLLVGTDAGCSNGNQRSKQQACENRRSFVRGTLHFDVRCVNACKNRSQITETHYTKATTR